MNYDLVNRAMRCLEELPEVETALRRYAQEIGVSLDHVILGALQLLAEDYNAATGHGKIPCLH